jgi:hypothetical protein
MQLELVGGERAWVESDLPPESYIAFPLSARKKYYGMWVFGRNQSPPRPFSVLLPSLPLQYCKKELITKSSNRRRTKLCAQSWCGEPPWGWTA